MENQPSEAGARLRAATDQSAEPLAPSEHYDAETLGEFRALMNRTGNELENVAEAAEYVHANYPDLATYEAHPAYTATERDGAGDGLRFLISRRPQAAPLSAPRPCQN